MSVISQIRILVALLSNVKSGVMLSSDNRNIMDYWIFNARYCFEYVFDVIRYNFNDVL